MRLAIIQRRPRSGKIINPVMAGSPDRATTIAIVQRRPRSGKIIVLVALLLPVLFGMIGLVIDSGMLMATHRQAQNAADAAALSAAMDKLRGRSDATMTQQANTYVQQYNGLGDATLELFIPPREGPFAGNPRYVEAVVTTPAKVWFMQVLGQGPARTVRARAVAGYKPVSSALAAAVLDPTAVPGLSVGGGAALFVNGRLAVNSPGAGYDESGNPVDLGYPRYAAATGSGSIVQAADIQVVGGVDTPANFRNLPGQSGSPLHAAALSAADPLRSLPTPDASNVPDLTRRGGVSLTSGRTTLRPGVYDYIEIRNNATVTFLPGIYILKATRASALTITGGAKVTGDGVMFYNTGSNYLTNGAGYYDALDGENPPPPADNATFGDVTINARDVYLRGLDDPDSPFDGMLFYQRRANTKTISFQGGGANSDFLGTVYAKWANLKLAGQGTYEGQFLVGTLSVSGQANVTINYADTKLGKVEQVFLVE